MGFLSGEHKKIPRCKIHKTALQEFQRHDRAPIFYCLRCASEAEAKVKEILSKKGVES